MSAEVVDLADRGLPLLDEPIPARMQAYHHDHTRRWSAEIGGADAFVIVTPEYNHGYPAALKNALDYLYHEWRGKPVAFLGYGWGGGRMAVDQLRQVVKELGMQALDPALHISLRPAMFNERHQMIDPERALSPHREAAIQLVRTLMMAPATEALESHEVGSRA